MPLRADPCALGCRELTHYRGEPDPFKGDVPNQRVRDSAKEALDAVFAATDVPRAAAAPPLQARRLVTQSRK